MHELSLTLSILDIIDEQAVKHGFKRVNALKLSLGRLSCVEPKAIEFAFSVQSKGTAAEGAQLEFEIHPIVIYCFSCQKEIKLQSYEAICTECGGLDVILKSGTEELKLLELDVD